MMSSINNYVQLKQPLISSNWLIFKIGFHLIIKLLINIKFHNTEGYNLSLKHTIDIEFVLNGISILAS